MVLQKSGAHPMFSPSVSAASNIQLSPMLLNHTARIKCSHHVVFVFRVLWQVVRGKLCSRSTNSYEQRQVAHQAWILVPCNSGLKQSNAEKAPAWNVDVGQWPGIDCMLQQSGDVNLEPLAKCSSSGELFLRP